MQTLIGILAIIIAVGSVIFAAIQTRILASQTKVLQITAELSYNLEIIVRMNEAILQIADERKSRAHVWGKVDKQNSRAAHHGRVLLDVLDAAVSGRNRLAQFRDSEFEDWPIYAEYVLERSANLREELRDHSDWWPHLATIAKRRPHR
jgi:hypothetical protein